MLRLLNITISIIISATNTQHPIEIKTIDKTENWIGFEFSVICHWGDAVGQDGLILGDGHGLVNDGQ